MFTVRFEPYGPLFDPTIDTALRTTVASTLTAAAAHLTGSIQRATPVGATGILRGSWTFTIASPDKLESVIGTPVSYAGEVEYGRPPGPVDPVALELWVQRKLGIGQPRSRSVAIMIANKKARVATPGQFFVAKTLARELPIVEAKLFGPLGLAISSVLGGV